jgi:hypothetical protein
MYVGGMETNETPYAQRVANTIRFRWKNAGRTNRDLAVVLGLKSEDHAGRKLTGKSELRLSEVESIALALDTTPERLSDPSEVERIIAAVATGLSDRE